MKIATTIIIVLFLYLRRPVKCVINMIKITNLLDNYLIYFKGDRSEKEKSFNEIARKRPWTNLLLHTFDAPSYKDFFDDYKLNNFFIELMEAHDSERYFFTIYLHPKYAFKDVFFLPSNLLKLLLGEDMKKGTSFVTSFFSWILTMLFSLYSSEIKVFINSLFVK